MKQVGCVVLLRLRPQHIHSLIVAGSLHCHCALREVAYSCTTYQSHPVVFVGVAFHQRYISQTTCAASRPATCLSDPGHEQYGVYGKPGIGFHNYNALAGSSGLDRTLLSAESFLSGVFPAASLAASSNSSSGVLQVRWAIH
jgi:hypothetical protein